MMEDRQPGAVQGFQEPRDGLSRGNAAYRIIGPEAEIVDPPKATKATSEELSHVSGGRLSTAGSPWMRSAPSLPRRQLPPVQEPLEDRGASAIQRDILYGQVPTTTRRGLDADLAGLLRNGETLWNTGS